MLIGGPPALDFAGLAQLHGWAYMAAADETELAAGLARLGRTLKRNTLLELRLDPALKPITASRHF